MRLRYPSQAVGVILLAALVGTIGGVTAHHVTTDPVTATPAATPTVLPSVIESRLSYNPGCANAGYIPNPCIWGIGYPSFVVESASYYEYGLVPGSSPIGDYDYGTNHVQRPVHMPGGYWDHYPIVAIIFVPGSGTVVIAHTPNGGEFALVHLDGGRVRPGLSVIRGGTVIPATPLPVPAVQRLSDGELTALAVQRIMASRPARSGLHAGQILKGGDFVALSAWPLDPAFGNGSAGAANAHLCLVTDVTARAWFLMLGAGHDAPKPKPKKKPFPVKLWGKRPHRNRHGHLLYQAAKWLPHARFLGAYTDHDRWHPKTKRNRHAYMDYHYRHGHLRCWPAYHRCKASKQ